MTAVVLLVVAAGCVAAGALVWWIAQRHAEAAKSLPPLFFPLTPSEPVHLHGNGNGIGNGTGNGNGNGYRSGNGNGNGTSHRAEKPVLRTVAFEPPRTNHRRTPVAAIDDRNDEMETIRFVRESDVSVQLLPGRLEVLEGPTQHKEIRFVRVPGEPAQIILGREPGPSPQYVGLGSPTVSRRHARFDYADSRWNVKNLSRTNPLIVNDDELFDTDVARPLVDGDRLELGEVVLRFHAH